MLRRKLEAIEYHSPSGVDIKNSEDVKALVIWLEDQKIRHKKIEDRSELRTSTGEKWTQTFHQYVKELECPYDPTTELSAVLDWLLGVAVRYEYSDNCQDHSEMSCGLRHMVVHSQEKTKSALDIDPSGDTFRAGTQALAKIVQVGTIMCTHK